VIVTNVFSLLNAKLFFYLFFAKQQQQQIKAKAKQPQLIGE